MRGAPLRIERHANQQSLGPEATGDEATAGLAKWAAAVAKLVPGEVVSAYLAGKAVLQEPPPSGTAWWVLWTLACLVAVLGLRAWMTSDKGSGVPPEWSAVVTSMLSFCVWVYSFGDVFMLLGVWSEKGSALVLIGWTLFAPLSLYGLKKVFRE